MSEMVDVVRRYIERKAITEQEYIARIKASGYDCEEQIEEVMAGNVLPCIPFFPLTRRILELTPEESDELYRAAERDADRMYPPKIASF